MYDVTLKDAVAITGKTKRTIQRYMGLGRLTFAYDANGKKVLSREELLEVVGIVTPVTKVLTPDNVTHENNYTITLTSEQLKEIIKGAVSEAIKEVAPLLLGQSKDTLKVKASTYSEVIPVHKNEVAQEKSNEVIKVDEYGYFDDMSFIK